MAEIKIKKESLPQRCDVCHQADLFDPLNGDCLRCRDTELTIMLAQPAGRLHATVAEQHRSRWIINGLTLSILLLMIGLPALKQTALVIVSFSPYLLSLLLVVWMALNIRISMSIGRAMESGRISKPLTPRLRRLITGMCYGMSGSMCCSLLLFGTIIQTQAELGSTLLIGAIIGLNFALLWETVLLYRPTDQTQRFLK